jgi:hypothetical protein
MPADDHRAREGTDRYKYPPLNRAREQPIDSSRAADIGASRASGLMRLSSGSARLVLKRKPRSTEHPRSSVGMLHL